MLPESQRPVESFVRLAGSPRVCRGCSEAVPSRVLARLVHFAKWLLIGAVVASVPGSVVGAPTKAEQANAGKKFREGERLFAKHDYAAAAAAFEEAYGIAPHPDALLNAIDARRKAGDLVLAARNCQRLIRDYPGEKAASDARGHLGEITPKVARLDLQVQGSATSVAVDGAPVELAAAGPTEVYVDAGDHVVTGTVDGKPFERRLSVVAGARGTVLLQAEAPTEEPGATPPPPSTPPPSSKPLHPAIFFVGAGLTATAGGLLIWSGLDTNGARDDFDAAPTRAGLDDGLSRQLRTNVLIGVTAGLGVTTAALGIFATEWGGGALESARLVVGPGSVHLGGTF
jgi:hypothetical protein